jgi:prephenate dehydrogenase
VVGLVRSGDAAEQARRLGAVNRASTDAAILDGSDVVVIVTPIDEVASLLDRVGHLVNAGSIITDVASVKRPVRKWVTLLPEPGLFLGGHPLAGKSTSGLAASDPSLFKGEPWIFTPLEFQNLRPFEPWLDLVTAIGAQPRFLSPEEHDQQIAYLSHLAFTVSSAYAQTVNACADRSLAGPGYRSMTRLSEGDAQMYESIARENREPLIAAIDAFSQILQRFRDRIDRQEAVRDLFQAGSHAAV